MASEDAELATRVERKLLLHIASLVFLLYFSFAIDRGNIGFAALQMNVELGLTAQIFGLGSGLFTLAYLLFQAPNAEMLRRLGARRGFALVACAWGLVSGSTAFVADQHWFLVNRFALGVSEAGFHAFIIYYISTISSSSSRSPPMPSRGWMTPGSRRSSCAWRPISRSAATTS
jgi:ACS family tartrate transporter-like MFS transporter